MGCNPSGNSQANTTESPQPEEAISLPNLQTLQNLQEAQKSVQEAAVISAADSDDDGPKFSSQYSFSDENKIEMMEQRAQLANEEAKKALSLINSLGDFLPAGTEFPLRFEEAKETYDSSSRNKNRRLVKNQRGGSDIISRASKIAESVDGVGKSDPFLPPVEVGVYQGIGLISRILEPKAVVRQSSNPSKPNVYKRKFSPIQLKGTAISKQSSAILEIEGIAHIVFQGDVLAGMKVVEIREEKIVLDKKGKRYTLTLSQ